MILPVSTGRGFKLEIQEERPWEGRMGNGEGGMGDCACLIGCE